MSAAQAVNSLVLTACVAELGVLRFTPAGLPAIDMRLEHESTLVEVGQPRKVAVALKAVAFGATAERLAKLEREEQELLGEYAAAHYLASWQMALRVRTEGGTQSVRDLLVALQHHDLICEYAFKMTRDHLVQLIYQKQRGCRLVKWPLL